MKKLVLLLFLSLFSGLTAQDGISIVIDGQTTELSGQAYNVVATSNLSFDVPFDVFNNTGQSHQWRVTRKKISVGAGWTDGLCWGHGTDPFGGTCFSSGQMNANPWTTPGSAGVLFTINNGEYGKMKASIDPEDLSSSTSHYRYYISDDGINYADSVDLIVNFMAALKPVKEPVSVTIVPNPASDYINITLNGAESVTMKMADVVGNLIMKETISSNKKIDVTDLKSGVYIISFEGSGVKSFSRKVIIRH
jgi:hypothetical protein